MKIETIINNNEIEETSDKNQNTVENFFFDKQVNCQN